MRLLKPTVHRLLMTKVAAKSLKLALFCKKSRAGCGLAGPQPLALRLAPAGKNVEKFSPPPTNFGGSVSRKKPARLIAKEKIGLPSLDTNLYTSKQCAQSAKNL